MSAREQVGHHAVPLAEAATRLGLTSDALRMRIRRGKANGFKRGGQVYVWLQEDAFGTPPVEAARAGASPGNHPSPSSSTERDPWPMVVEVQKDEIARLIQETERLNARLDRHLDEVKEMRQMLQREQVLRQQEQSLRRDVQRLLDRLIAHPALLGSRWTAARPEPTHPAERPTETGKQAGPPAGSRPPSDPGMHDENIALAEMLKEIGQSLREMEARDMAGPDVSPEKPPGESENES